MRFKLDKVKELGKRMPIGDGFSDLEKIYIASHRSIAGDARFSLAQHAHAIVGMAPQKLCIREIYPSRCNGT
jgi:hypothetical protein